MAGEYITDMEVADTPLDGSELLEVSQRSSTVAITAITISALAADNSYNDSANGFVAAGFAVGNRVNVVGFTGNVVNNIKVGTITALAVGKITIGGTDGDVIVDDAAGESVTISKWESRQTTAQEIADLAGGGGGGGLSVVQTEAADYTVDPGDVGNYIRLTDATAKTVSVDLEATTALPDDGEWHFRNAGAGDATFDPDVGVTINVPAGGTLVMEEGMTVTLKRVAADEFDLLGQTVPV